MVSNPVWQEDGCIYWDLSEWDGRGKCLRWWLLMGASQLTHLPVPLPQSAVPFLILVALIESNLIVTYVVAVAAGISVAAAFLLPW